MLRYAYNTNGLQNHRLEDAVELVADAGYDGLAITLDIHHLDPMAPELTQRAEALRRRLDARGLGCVIETGARYLLDPRRKHEPTLVSATREERDRRLAFLRTAVDVAHVLEAECVSCFAGVPHELPLDTARGALLDGLARLGDYGAEKGVRVALEPEPGMAIADLDDALEFLPQEQWLALDVGHCLVTGERDPAAAVREFAGRAATITVEDMKVGEHVHLPFGEGDIDLPAVLAAVTEVGFTGLVCVELSRESHRAHDLVPASIAALRAAEHPVVA